MSEEKPFSSETLIPIIMAENIALKSEIKALRSMVKDLYISNGTTADEFQTIFALKFRQNLLDHADELANREQTTSLKDFQKLISESILNTMKG